MTKFNLKPLKMKSLDSKIDLLTACFTAVYCSIIVIGILSIVITMISKNVHYSYNL